MKRVFLAAASVAALCSTPAEAGLSDWQPSPFTADIGSSVLTVGGAFDGVAYAADQPDFPGLDQSGVSGSATVYANLMRTYDTGLVLGIKSSFQVFHDKLSVDNYGGDFVEKVYGVAQTGLGRVEFGMTDGAAYTLAVPGPMVDGVTSLDNPNATFFLDPTTGRAFVSRFTINSAVESSLNYAKVTYYSPRLFGVEIGASFTPSEGKDVIPGLANGPQVPNRMRGIWEAAISYQGSSGRLSYSASAAIAVGHSIRKTPSHAGLTDWAIGAQGDYDLSDELKLSLGGEYRQTNQYTFDINDALAGSDTRALHLGTTLSFGSWIVGGEYATGSAEGALAMPTQGIHGYEASVGYTLNTAMQITTGWQQWNYATRPGAFYDGAPHIKMNAGFLHLNFHI